MARLIRRPTSDQATNVAGPAAVLVSSHLISEMALTADRLLVIGAGRLLADTGIADLTSGHASLEAAYFTLTADSTQYRGDDLARRAEGRSQ